MSNYQLYLEKVRNSYNESGLMPSGNLMALKAEFDKIKNQFNKTKQKISENEFINKLALVFSKKTDEKQLTDEDREKTKKAIQQDDYYNQPQMFIDPGSILGN